VGGSRTTPPQAPVGPCLSRPVRARPETSLSAADRHRRDDQPPPR
jgi:hypothetical protein